MWPEVLEEIKGRRRFTWILLSQNAQVHEVRDGTLLLAMSTMGARDSFGKSGNEDILREALVTVLGADFKISVMVDPGAASASGRVAPAARGRPAGAPSQTPEDRNPRQSGRPPDDVTGAGPYGGADPSRATAPDRAGSPDPWPADHADQDPTPPIDPAIREQARAAIRPTRTGAVGAPVDDDRDALADVSDSDLEESGESHTELLARRLGAEVIAEEERGA